jgi:hypothetical protein
MPDIDCIHAVNVSGVFIVFTELFIVRKRILLQ